MVRSMPPVTSTGRARAKGLERRRAVRRGGTAKIGLSASPIPPRSPSGPRQASNRTSGAAGKSASSLRKEQVAPIRSWTFVSKPKLTRYSDTDKHVLVERIKEPAVRILEDITEVVLVAYLPGVNEKDIRIELYGDILEISASTNDEFGLTRYAKEILLPFAADLKDTKSSFKDDILQIEVRKKMQNMRGE